VATSSPAIVASTEDGGLLLGGGVRERDGGTVGVAEAESPSSAIVDSTHDDVDGGGGRIFFSKSAGGDHLVVVAPGATGPDGCDDQPGISVRVGDRALEGASPITVGPGVSKAVEDAPTRVAVSPSSESCCVRSIDGSWTALG
jgi:hypothetical protein